MAKINNQSFSWCKTFFEVRNNYSKSQCLQMLKDHLKTVSGADPSFKQAFLNASEMQFSFDCRYIPAYQFNISADFEWSETNTEKVDIVEKDFLDISVKNGTRLEITTKDKHKQRRIRTSWTATGPASCNVLNFIGSENQRFKELNLPSDLPYSLYSETYDVMSEEAIRRYVNSNAPEKDFGQGQTRSNITYVASAFFVPMVMITFVYQNREYMSVVNQHNGSIDCSYPISQSAINDAAKAVKKVIPHNRIRTILLIISPIISCIWLFLVKGSLLWDILFAIAMIIFEFVVLGNIIPTTESYWREYYGKSKAAGDKELDNVTVNTWVIIVFWLIGVVAHLFLGL